jgi:hypothetical protein
MLVFLAEKRSDCYLNCCDERGSADCLHGVSARKVKIGPVAERAKKSRGEGLGGREGQKRAGKQEWLWGVSTARGSIAP